MAFSTPRSAPQPSVAAGSAALSIAGLVRPVARTAGPWSRAGRRLRRNRLAMSGAALLIGIAAVALIAPPALGINPYEQRLTDAFLPPASEGHILGTDHVGRDVLLRLIDG